MGIEGMRDDYGDDIRAFFFTENKLHPLPHATAATTIQKEALNFILRPTKTDDPG